MDSIHARDAVRKDFKVETPTAALNSGTCTVDKKLIIETINDANKDSSLNAKARAKDSGFILKDNQGPRSKAKDNIPDRNSLSTHYTLNAMMMTITGLYAWTRIAPDGHSRCNGAWTRILSA